MPPSRKTNLETSEAHLFSSVEQNVSNNMFNLISLPFVPKLLVFRYLDLKSLSKIRQASISMNNFVKSHRPRLVSFGFLEELIVECDENDSQTINTHRVYNVLVDISGSLTFGSNFRWIFEDESDRPSFFEWFTDKFSKTFISNLIIDGMSIRDEDVDQLEKMMKKQGLSVSSLDLTDCDISSLAADTVVRFLKAMGKELRWLTIICETENTRQLFSREFFDLIPALHSLDCKTTETINEEYVMMAEISPTVHTLPPRCNLYSEMIFPFETLKKGIHSWWRNDTKIQYWAMSLLIVYIDLEFFAESVGLPYTITNGCILFHRADGSHLCAQPIIDSPRPRTKIVDYSVEPHIIVY